MDTTTPSIQYPSGMYMPMMAYPTMPYVPVMPQYYWQPSPQPNNPLNDPMFIKILQALQQLVMKLTQLQTALQDPSSISTPTPSTPTNPSTSTPSTPATTAPTVATILLESSMPNMSEYHRHTAPGKASPLIRHNEAETYKEIQVETPQGKRIVANPGPQLIVGDKLSKALKAIFNVDYNAPYTTTLYDNDRDGKLSINDLIYMNDNQTGAPIKEALFSANDDQALQSYTPS